MDWRQVEDWTTGGCDDVTGAVNGEWWELIVCVESSNYICVRHEGGDGQGTPGDQSTSDTKAQTATEDGTSSIMSWM